MGVTVTDPVVPDEGTATWTDTVRTWGTTKSTTWGGWSPRGGTTKASTPPRSTVTARDPSR